MMTFFREWLPLAKSDFRILALLADKGDFEGNLSDLCRCFSLDTQTKNRNKLREAILRLSAAGLILHKEKGRTHQLALVPQAQSIEFPRAWYEILRQHTSAQNENFFTVLFVSVAIAALCWVILLFIVILLSGKVIRPVLVGMEKQKQFITNAGHEMKTPLAIIQSNNDTMALIHGENKYNVHIRNQTKRLNVLMSNLLTLAKLDEEIPLPTETVNISDIANELIPVYMDDAQNRGLHFTVRIEPDIVMQTNRDSFRQMLTILLDNALKYTPDNGSIHLSLARNGRRIQIIEENTCTTSHEPNPERLFERFYRGDAARTQSKETSGYGIGLSAARAICENFGGKLYAEYPSAETVRFIAKF